MTYHENLRLLAFVGLRGSGKTTAVEYVASRGVPKIHDVSNTTSLIEQIERLTHAGQHRIVLDAIDSWETYKTLLHEFPAALHIVAVFAPKHARFHREAQHPLYPMNEAQTAQEDWKAIEAYNYGGTIAEAEFVIENNASITAFTQKIDAVLEELTFLR